MRFRLLAAATLVVGLACPTLAHHSLGSYDQTTLVTVRGTVSRIQWLNPHALITLAVRNPDGSTRSLEVEIAPPGALMRKGIDQTIVKIGDDVTFQVWIPKDPQMTSRSTGRTLTLADGRQLDIADSLMWQPLNDTAPTRNR